MAFFIRILGKSSHPHHPDRGFFLSGSRVRLLIHIRIMALFLSGSRVRLLIYIRIMALFYPDHGYDFSSTSGSWLFFIRITVKASHPHPDHGSFLIRITSKSSYPRSSVSWLFFSLDHGQGVTKRCRLSWLTNSALVYESQCGGRGACASQ